MFGLAVKMYKAFQNSWKGMKYAYSSEWTFRLELAILIISFPLAFMISSNQIERILMLSAIMLIIIIELINTAIETTVNRISRDPHELSGLAKDMASGAMLFAIANAVITWSLILL